ncbi:hypothetical protein [uncultured Tateyamaria sp.]|nr:hypothetical protein [uncultured Tateyamaria sp.]
MLDIYAQTFMNATRNRRCTSVKLPRKRWWHGPRTTCINLDRL